MQAAAYDEISSVYDYFQKEIDVQKWAGFLETVIQKHGPASGDGKDGKLLLCDLGCGTASVSIELASRGYDVIGIDLSANMLQIAKKNAERAKVDVLFLCQDIVKLDLFGTVDVILCLLDTVNHILHPKDLAKMLSHFRNFLNPNGLFIFDVATKYHLENSLGNQFFYEVEEEHALLWENSYNKKSRISTSDITLFTDVGTGKYDRHETQIRERVYTHEELMPLLDQAGLDLVFVSGECVFRSPKNNEDRNFYCARLRSEASQAVGLAVGKGKQNGKPTN